MTLEAYDPDQLDQLALRTLDLTAELRRMAVFCRKHGISSCPLHDKKALEWVARLEDWTHKTSARLELLGVRQRAIRRAEKLTSPPRATTSTRRRKKQ